MQAKVILFVTIVAIIALSSAKPADPYNNNNGKYQLKEYNHSGGKYRAHSDGRYHPNPNEGQNSGGYYDAAGRYVHNIQPYRHVHDNRELGKYVHIPYPYDGGYGPYSGMNLPYVHDDRPYDHNLYTTTTTTTTPKPTTTTKRTTTTTTTTTTTPRSVLFNYEEEGKHKILHQEEVRKHDKYDHSFLTENGIYGEENAKLHKNGGTHAMGYYEYTGDDGKLYRVNYSSNDKGFNPMGEHIPTPPPIPEAIARALKYVEDQRKANGDMPIFDHRGFRINHMPKELMAKIKAVHIEDMPKEIGAKILELQHEVEELEMEEEREEAEAQRQRQQQQNESEDVAMTTEATTEIY